MGTTLYRHFDLNGNLLYVGISLSALSRLHQHEQEAHWFNRIDVIQLEQFATRPEALAAEKDAIQIERPAYNYHWWAANPRRKPPTPPPSPYRWHTCADGEHRLGGKSVCYVCRKAKERIKAKVKRSHRPPEQREALLAQQRTWRLKQGPLYRPHRNPLKHRKTVLEKLVIGVKLGTDRTLRKIAATHAGEC